MEDEQNNKENAAETSNSGNKNAGTGGAAASYPAAGDNNDQPRDDYYEVDHAKKDVISTIGDGEMHDEGLVGTGDIPTNLQSSMERLTDEQDEAEAHDSEQ